MTDTTTRRKNIVEGACIADAAALGLHWIYAQPKIRRAAPDTPEFLEPDPANYEGVPAYFAHAKRHAGDLSMYGEGVLVTLRSVAETGAFDWQHYARAFGEHFGFGGEYVGYIDTPTRITLVNRIKQEETLLETAMSVPFDGEEKKKRAVASKVLGNAQILRGQALRDAVHEAITLTKGDDAQIALADRMIEILEGARTYPGADDDQLPALTKVPVLVAAYPDNPELLRMVEEAVRVTNNNDTAVAWAIFVTRLLQWSLGDDAGIDGLRGAIERIAGDSPAVVGEAITDMLRRVGDDNKKVTMKLGPACELKSGVSVALHNLLGSSDYVDAVRRNIYACGDSCGRAMVVGGLGGALFGGIPDDWRARVNRREEISGALDTIVS